ETAYAAIYHLQRRGDQWYFSDRLPRPGDVAEYAYNAAGPGRNVSDPCGYAYDSNKANLFYRDPAGSLVRLNWDGASWRASTLLAASKEAEVGSAGEPVCLYRASDKRHCLFYFSAYDTHVHALSSTDGAAWTHYDLSAMAGAAAAAGRNSLSYGAPAAYLWPHDNTLHVVYRGGDNRLYELYCSNNSWETGWRLADLSYKTGAQLWGSPIGWSLPKDKGDKGQHIAYVGPDEHLYHAYMLPGGSWKLEDLTRAVVK
ncbi:MAG TPA: hypothetical protein VGV38_09625, partial [Pyrinomonadaceae bacterium]|nr:hypothetical protein [Pyrinomonadaceae bacterium]